MNASAFPPGSPASILLNAIGRSWWIVLLYGLIAVAFGAFVIARPFETAAALAFALGVVALIEAVISFFGIFGSSPGVPKWWLLLYALVSGVFGVLALRDPLGMAGAMVLVLAFWLVVAGILRIAFAIRVRKLIPDEWFLILSGLLVIALGVLFAIYPGTGLLATTIWVGVGALIYGAFQVFAAFRIRKLAAA